MKRERILITIMGCTILYTLYVYGVEFFTSSPQQQTYSAVAPTSQTALASTQTILNGKQLSPQERRLLLSLATNWGANPFYMGRLKHTTPVNDEQPVENPLLTYEGFVAVGDTFWAIINGNGYQKGEHIPSTPFVIANITKSAVELLPQGTSENSVQPLTLPLIEISF